VLKKKGSLKKTILSIFLWHLLPKSRSWGVQSGRGLSPLYHINIEQIFQSWKIINKHFILLQHPWRKLRLKIFGNFHDICARLACNNPSRKGLKFLSVYYLLAFQPAQKYPKMWTLSKIMTILIKWPKIDYFLSALAL
jgi:hypothetical protein